MSERDELTEQVRERTYNYVSENNKDGTLEGYIRITGEFATDIIALVRQAERKKLREALLSDEAVEALAELHMPAVDYRAMSNGHMRGIYDMSSDRPMCKVDLRDHYRYAANIALSAIGLTESEGE